MSNHFDFQENFFNENTTFFNNHAVHIWTTKDGVDINIQDMELSHIKNVIKFLIEKKPNNYELGIDIFVDELIRRCK